MSPEDIASTLFGEPILLTYCHARGGIDRRRDGCAACLASCVKACAQSLDHVRFWVRQPSGSNSADAFFEVFAFFDCAHEMGDPTGAAAHVRASLVPGGTWMVVEPFANDDVSANLNPVGRIYYSASALICVPASLSQEVG